MPDRVVPPRCGLVTLWLATIVVSLGACRSTNRVGDRFYQNGRYPEAAAAFQVYLDSEAGEPSVEARTLYRMAVMYAMVDSSIHDAERSLELLDQLLRSHPDSEYAVSARVLRDLQSTTLDLHAETVGLRQRLAAIEADLARQTAAIQALLQEVERSTSEVLGLEKSVAVLEAEARACRQALAERQQELLQLERLKAIDLAKEPP